MYNYSLFLTCGKKVCTWLSITTCVCGYKCVRGSSMILGSFHLLALSSLTCNLTVICTHLVEGAEHKEGTLTLLKSNSLEIAQSISI